MAGARAVTTTARRGLSGFAGVQGSLSNYRSQGAPQRFRPLSAFGGACGAPMEPKALPQRLPPRPPPVRLPCLMYLGARAGQS